MNSGISISNMLLGFLESRIIDGLKDNYFDQNRRHGPFHRFSIDDDVAKPCRRKVPY
jgi:hypothetical protein